MSHSYIVRTSVLDTDNNIVSSTDLTFDDFEPAHDLFCRLEEDHQRDWTEEEVAVSAFLADLYMFEYKNEAGTAIRVTLLTPHHPAYPDNGNTIQVDSKKEKYHGK